MKTLNEVIKGMNCFDPLKECDDCPYADYHVMGNGIGTPCFEMVASDATYYLKRMRDNKSAAPWNNEKNRYCCERCGHYVGKYDQFCGGCGAELTDWTEAGRKAI